jgi:hypothetical protein
MHEHGEHQADRPLPQNGDEILGLGIALNYRLEAGV